MTNVPDKFFEGKWTIKKRQPDNNDLGFKVNVSKFRIKQKANGDWILDNKKALDKWVPDGDISLVDQGPWVNETTAKFLGLVSIDSDTYVVEVLGHPNHDEVTLRLKGLGIASSPDGSGRAGRGG
jgi:hypothetical protein